MKATPTGNGMVHVEFDWSDKHGTCYDCGLPAAYEVGDWSKYHRKLCSVCTALAVYEGDTILAYLFEDQAVAL